MSNRIISAAVVLSLGIVSVALGSGLFAHRAVGARPQVVPAAATGVGSALAPRSDDRPPPRAETTAEIIVRAASLNGGGFMGVAAIDPETGRWRVISEGPNMGAGPVSPDGRFLVYPSLVEGPGIWVHDMVGRIPPRRIFERRGDPIWVNEGRQVVISAGYKGSDGIETWRVNTDGSGRVRLPIPKTDLVLDASRDGLWLVTRAAAGDRRHQGRVTLIHSDGTAARHLSEGSADGYPFLSPKIAPDGRSVAYAEITKVDDAAQIEIFIVDIEGLRKRRIPTHFEPDNYVVLCWSPDGSRLALNPVSSRNNEGSIWLVDFNGPNFHFRKLPFPRGEVERDPLRLEDACSRAPARSRPRASRRTRPSQAWAVNGDSSLTRTIDSMEPRQ